LNPYIKKIAISDPGLGNMVSTFCKISGAKLLFIYILGVKIAIF